MRHHPVRLGLIATLSLLFAGVARAQDTYKIEPSSDPPPAALAGPIKETLEPKGYRVMDGSGKALATIWLRKGIPASAKPGASKGSILFPFFAEGELLGSIQYAAEGRDYRDQSISPGVYTLRYGIQPMNGDHLGVSLYRDYVLLSAAAKDKEAAALKQKDLEKRSAEVAGSNHPAVLMLLKAPNASGNPTAVMVNDQEKNLWGAVLPLTVSVKGESAPVRSAVQLVVVGMAM
jgi:hypothetical protein